MRTMNHKAGSSSSCFLVFIFLISLFSVLTEVAFSCAERYLYVSNGDAEASIKTHHPRYSSRCGSSIEKKVYLKSLSNPEISVKDAKKPKYFSYFVNFTWTLELQNEKMENNFQLLNSYTFNYCDIPAGRKKCTHNCSILFCTHKIKDFLNSSSTTKVQFKFSKLLTTEPGADYNFKGVFGYDFNTTTPSCTSTQIRDADAWTYGRVVNYDCGEKPIVKIEYNIPNKSITNAPFQYQCSSKNQSQTRYSRFKCKNVTWGAKYLDLMLPKGNTVHADALKILLWVITEKGLNFKMCRINLDMKEILEKCNTNNTTLIAVVSCVCVLLIFTIGIVLFSKKCLTLPDYIRKLMEAPKIKLYIIHSADHKKHEDVILKFASFLEEDLKFNVILDLYEQEQIYADSLGWLDHSLKTSNKVLVIWSPGVQKRHQSYKENDHNFDLFAIALENIKRDFISCKNLDKYFFGYFDYCGKSDVPNDFKEYDLTNFVLMKEFESLYFQLTKLQEELPGKRLKQENASFDRYADPSVNNFGPALEKAINEMCSLVKHNPNWFDKREEWGGEGE